MSTFISTYGFALYNFISNRTISKTLNFIICKGNKEMLEYLNNKIDNLSERINSNIGNSLLNLEYEKHMSTSILHEQLNDGLH